MKKTLFILSLILYTPLVFAQETQQIDVNEFKTLLLDSCKKGITEKFADTPLPSAFTTDYCSCYTNKVLKNFSIEELISIGAEGNKEAFKKVQDESEKLGEACAMELMK